MRSQLEKAQTFRALHERRHAFIVPNPGDAGTARILADLGFEALATTSAGIALLAGERDHAIGRDRMMALVGAIASATDLPVTGDLENGYGDDPAEVAETIRRAAEVGLVGCSIEDATTRAGDPVYEQKRAAERIAAAAEAARALPFPFTLTARADNYLVGRANLADTIARLQAYQEAGADVLFAPGLTKKDDIASVVKSVDRPLNVLVMPQSGLSLSELSSIGVKRVSVGSALCRIALDAILGAASEMQERGTFSFLGGSGSRRTSIQ